MCIRDRAGVTSGNLPLSRRPKIALARLWLGLQAASFAHRKPAVLSGMSGVSHLRAVTSGRGSATRRSEAETRSKKAQH